MTSCTTENWTLESLASALQDMHKDNKKIAVPMFQRGKRWGSNQQRTFIDSLIKGFPVGTMLFYETIEDGKQTYILVDGLQRGNSIKKYMNDPTEFFYDKNISDEFCQTVLQVVNANVPDNYGIIRAKLTSFIKAQKTFKNLQYYQPAKEIADYFSSGFEPIGELINIMTGFFEERQALYEQIAMTVIPVIVYHGPEENLPEIFDRINSQGTPLDQYEVYAAAWPVNKRFKIKNTDIVEHAIKKYDAFIEDGFSIHGYDREKMRTTREVNAFEYLFGLSKYLVSKYDLLGFNKSLADDTVNPLGFELVNACLNDTDRIKTLYQNIYDIDDIDGFENALYKAIDFVIDSVSAIIRFKGNSRTGTKLFHSKYQILSMISTTFKEMYDEGDYSSFSVTWADKKNSIARNLRMYYVLDIITNYWSEGGTGKIHSAAKPNRYAVDISPRTWRIALDGFFDKSMSRTELKQIPNPKSEEYVILNCIYLNTFTAMDQLSINKFDVEHIAPKEQMKKLISTTKGAGLPISCIANLCYLPDYVNRSKHDKNFYQDKKYLQHINLEEVEKKYSFTTVEDLEWMDMPYQDADDYDALKQFYTEFCYERYKILKRLFCESMGIDYEAMNAEVIGEIKEEPVAERNEEIVVTVNQTRTANYINDCIKRIEAYRGEFLKKVGRTTYKTEDGKTGFVFCVSKAYKQGQRQKYWFGYRRNPLNDIDDCENKIMVFGCRDDKEVLAFPVSEIEKRTSGMNTSTDDDGIVRHWHVVFFRDTNGHMTQLLSKPDLQEIDIDKFKIDENATMI